MKRLVVPLVLFVGLFASLTGWANAAPMHKTQPATQISSRQPFASQAGSYKFVLYDTYVQNVPLALDINHGDTTPGAQAIVWNAGDQLNQQFALLPSRIAGGYRIQSLSSGLCLNVNHGSLSQGANIIQWYCDQDQPSNEIFYFSPGEVSGAYLIVAANSLMCLEPGGGVHAAAPVIQWTCNTGYDPAEEWIAL
jgi:Ricin-type beta-trefoil lectin domain-like